MELDPEVRKLPVALAAALRLREAGADHAMIAQALDLDPASVDALLELAEAKLARLRAARPDAHDVPS